jgi:hypothetical protein
VKLLLAVLAVIVPLTGCSTYAASRYAISADNVRTLRTFKGQSVNVGPFSAANPGQTEIMCRGVGPIKTPDGETFEHFVRKALVDELTIAEIYSSDAPIMTTGLLDAIDFSSGVGATWNIALTVTSSNGQSLSVSEEYKYTSSYYGETACNQTAQALMPAIQNVVGKVVRHPNFPALLR